MINNVGVHQMNAPISGRFFIWYGFRDDPTNQNLNAITWKYHTQKQTYQCAHMFSNILRCHRKTVLGTDYCFSHLPGIREITAYKSNHHSRVVDQITDVVAKEHFQVHDEVLVIRGQHLTQQEHVARYQYIDRSGPYEFAFHHASNPPITYYVDFAVKSDDIENLIIDDNNGNVYIDLNAQDFQDFHNHNNNPNRALIENSIEIVIRALQPINIGDSIRLKTTNTPASPQIFTQLPHATNINSYFFSIFGYRDLPSKYLTLDFASLVNHPNMKGPRNQQPQAIGAPPQPPQGPPPPPPPQAPQGPP